ncbi:MAG: hypothetical protein ACRDZY_14030, partial [Acidimicrobiales bacterium]
MEMEVKPKNETDSVLERTRFQDGSLIKPLLGEKFKKLPSPKEEVRLLASPALQNWERLLSASRRKEEVGTP